MSESPEPRWLDADENAAWMATAALLIRLPAALDAQLQADAGLSFFEYSVMALLSDQPEHRMQMSEIASITSSSLSRLSHTLTRLEKRGCVARERVPGPGRRTEAVLTETGMELVRSVAPAHVAHARHLLIDAVSREDLAALTRIGHALMERIDPDGTCPGLQRGRLRPRAGG